MAWLIKTETAQAMQAARKLGYQPTLEERARFAEQMREAYAGKDAAQPRNLKVAGTTAEILVEGVLTEKPDCFALIFGGGNVTYASIREALAAAEADPNVKDIVLNISSPGGEITGLFETFAALEAVSKPMRVRASMAASAAYGLAAVAGPIEPITPASEFGSIGVAVRLFLDEEVVDLASSEAPKKRPDITTDEGRAAILEELDALHELFVDAIARGRSASMKKKLTVATVNAEFGRGGMLVASEALKRGMIDKAAPKPRRKYGAEVEEYAPETAPTKDASTDRGGAPKKGKHMNLEELKAQHPELHAAVLADGQKAGQEQERKRVLAHLKLGKASGAMEVAEKAIETGASTMDEDVHASYLSASMNRRDQAARQTDSDTAGKAIGAAPVTEPETAPDLGDQVVELMEKQRGKKQ